MFSPKVRIITARIGMFLLMVTLLASCAKENLSEPLNAPETEALEKTLADFPSEITIDNWEEFIYAPPAVIAHFAEKERAAIPTVNTQPSSAFRDRLPDSRNDVVVGLVQGFNGSWTPMPGVGITVGNTPFPNSGATSPYNYFAIACETDLLCMDYPTSPVNGMSTFDIVLITQHILGINCFTTAREYLAADVDRDGQITTDDQDIMRDIILFIETEFTTTDNVLFVPDFHYDILEGTIAGCTVNENILFNLGNDNDPCLTPFQENLNRRAIKSGDVSGNFTF